MHNEHEAGSNCTYLVRQKWRNARNIFGVWTFAKKNISLEGHVIQGKCTHFQFKIAMIIRLFSVNLELETIYEKKRFFHKVN